MQRALRAGSGASQLEHSLAGERLVRCALLVNRWGQQAAGNDTALLAGCGWASE